MSVGSHDLLLTQQLIAGSGEALVLLTELGSEYSPVSQLNSRGYFGTAPYSIQLYFDRFAFMRTTVLGFG